MFKRLLGVLISSLALCAAVAGTAQASTDQGNADPTLSFFSGGGGAHANWYQDPNDSDGDGRDIQIVTTTSGYAGINVHHVYGWPTATYPNSSFDVKSNVPAPGGVSSLGSPRLVVQFSDGGDASLRPLALYPSWQTVTDPNWDNRGGSCPMGVGPYEDTWQQIQSCHAGTFVTNVYLTTDPYGLTYWIDRLNTAGRTWSQPSDNGNG